MEKKITEKIHEHAEKFAEKSSHLPPLFNDDNEAGGVSWKALDNIDYDVIGRILVSHLCIETYLNRYIEVKSSPSLDLMSANITFSQKLKIVKKDFSTMPVDFYTGISIINKIRNRFSHSLQSVILDSEVGIIEGVLSNFRSRYHSDLIAKPADGHPAASSKQQVRVIEDFTNSFCSFLAGAYTMAKMRSI